MIVQRKQGTSNPLPNSKAQEEKENEEICFMNALNPGDTGLVEGGPPLSKSPQLATPGIEPRESTAPLL